jgi:hypothetical protein
MPHQDAAAADTPRTGVAQEARDHDRSTLSCATALLILLILIELWSHEHLGFGLQDPGWLAPMVGAVSVAIPLTRRLLRRRERGALGRFTVRLFRWILRPWPIAVAYFVFTLLTLTRSSIAVIGGNAEDEVPVTVRQLDTHTAKGRRADVGKLDPAEFHALATTPFGRTYRVDAEGYVPATVKLMPLVRLRLQLGHELVLSPSILIRPSRTLLGDMEDSARLVLYEVRGPRRDSIAGSRTPAALLVGREQPITPRPEWTWELAGETADRVGMTLLQWARPDTASVTRPLNPGTRLEAVVLHRDGSQLASVSFSVRNERLMT